jgi:hypothetical protein
VRWDVGFGLEGSGNEFSGGCEMVVELGLSGFGRLKLDGAGRGDIEEMGLGWLEKLMAGVKGLVGVGMSGVFEFVGWVV